MKYKVRIIVSIIVLLLGLAVSHITERTRGSMLSSVATEQMEDSSVAYASAQLKADSLNTVSDFAIPSVFLIYLFLWFPLLMKNEKNNEEKNNKESKEGEKS